MINREVLKTIAFIFILFDLVILNCFNLSMSFESIKVVGLSFIFLAVIYLLLLKSDLEKLKNEYDNDISEYKNDINEYDKNYETEVEATKEDLANRGLLNSSFIIDSLDKLEKDRDDFKIYRRDKIRYKIKQFKINFKKAKYLVILNLVGKWIKK